MQRRTFTRLASTCLVGAMLAATRTTRAQSAEPEAPLVFAPKIIEALTAKDIVLDRPGQPARAGRPGRRDAAISLQVQFSFDSADLLPQGKRQLDELAMALNDKALLVSGFQLAGHTDKVGDADYNVKLSLARAEAVKAYLAEAHGVSTARLQTIGYGFAHLIDPAHPKAAINRRVEVRRLAVRVGPQQADSPPTAGRLVLTPK